MVNLTPHHPLHINALLSFGPLFLEWKKKMQDGNAGVSKYYTTLLSFFEQENEWQSPIHAIDQLHHKSNLIEILTAAVFPVSFHTDTHMYAIAAPFSGDLIFASQLFKKLFTHDHQLQSGYIISTPLLKNIEEEQTEIAYQLILNQLYGYQLKGNAALIYEYPDTETGFTRYFEMIIDCSFISVFCDGALPEFNGQKEVYQNIKALLKIKNLTKLLPLQQFRFEGMMLLHLNDVSNRETIAAIKTLLLTLRNFSDSIVFDHLQSQLQNLLQLKNIKMGITPFFKVNNHLVFSKQHIENSLLLHYCNNQQERLQFNMQFEKVFETDQQMIIAPTLKDPPQKMKEVFEYLYHQGYNSAIIAPLYANNHLIGLLTIVSEKEHALNLHLDATLEEVMPLFSLALEKSAETLNNEIDGIIKKNYTVVQNAVAWRFTEAALQYFHHKKEGQQARLEPIIFEEVYPLYGAVDIRNSSIERNQAIQQDILDQLNAAASVVEKAILKQPFPLLQEIFYRIKKFQEHISGVFLADEEMQVQHFLKEEIIPLFRHLKTVVPELQNEIEAYFNALDQHFEMLYNHRREFEESITHINTAIAQYVDSEQEVVQKLYPHYFERFVTDGVDFNIYIGQSISPFIPFNTFYLQNLKMWQLTLLAKTAQRTYLLQQQLSLPLQTTQLILAYNLPISISFRTAEHKFDVDGTYNIRYEIIKKRIDKVRIKFTNERLTKYGCIAIAYTQQKEAEEYREYIEYLQHKGLLLSNVEELDLEDLQGVTGMKALRVGVNFDHNGSDTISDYFMFTAPRK